MAISQDANSSTASLEETLFVTQIFEITPLLTKKLAHNHFRAHNI